MGQLGRVVRRLDLPHTVQGLLWRERLLGPDGGDAAQRLPTGQGRRPLVPRWRARPRT